MQNYNSKFKIFYFLLVFLTFNFYLLPLARAVTMSNENFILQMGNLNTAAGISKGEGYRLDQTVGQTAPGLYSGANYKVRAGFQYIHSIAAFKFTISETLIDFGILSATNPVSRTNNLTVSSRSPHGYSVTASENHPLLDPLTNALIPDTTCDNGSCSQSSSAVWTSILTYGFGYRCDNVNENDCESSFSDKTAYKQFADSSREETPETLMSGKNTARGREAQITYKVNISGAQPAGLYSNVITYIAAPTF